MPQNEQNQLTSTRKHIHKYTHILTHQKARKGKMNELQSCVTQENTEKNDSYRVKKFDNNDKQSIPYRHNAK